MYTAKDLRDKVCSHDEYYKQFVNQAIINYVGRIIGIEIIKNSTDEHFNDIPLVRWDALNVGIQQLLDKDFYKKCHNITYAEEYKNSFLWSLSQAVCIAKAAARVIKSNG